MTIADATDLGRRVRWTTKRRGVAVDHVGMIVAVRPGPRASRIVDGSWNWHTSSWWRLFGCWAVFGNSKPRLPEGRNGLIVIGDDGRFWSPREWTLAEDEGTTK